MPTDDEEEAYWDEREREDLREALAYVFSNDLITLSGEHPTWHLI